MKHFDYFAPTEIIFGAGRVTEAGALTARYGKKAMLVTIPKPAALPLSTWYPCAEGRVRLPSSIPWAPRTAKAVFRALRPGAPKTPLASRS